MFIEQIIEFELRGPGPCSRTCTLTTGFIYIFEWIIIYYENIAGGNVTYFLLPGPNHLQNLTPKGKTLNMFWT